MTIPPSRETHGTEVADVSSSSSAQTGPAPAIVHTWHGGRFKPVHFSPLLKSLQRLPSILRVKDVNEVTKDRINWVTRRAGHDAAQLFTAASHITATAFPCTHAHTQTHASARTHTHAHTRARTHTHVHAHTGTRTHTHTHTHTRTHAHTHAHTHTVDTHRPTAQPALPAQSAEATVLPTGLSTLFSLPEILLLCAPHTPSSSRLPFLASSLDLLGLLWAALLELLQRDQGPLPGALRAAVSVPKQGHQSLPGFAWPRAALCPDPTL